MGENDYAIVVGVRYPGLYPLKATVNDATRVLEWLKSEEGGAVPVNNCTTIFSEPELPPRTVMPTKRDLDIALGSLLSGREKPGGRFYFYFAGHGFSTDSDEVGMLMADATIDFLNRNLGLRSFIELFRNRLFFREIVIILDCCRDTSPRNRNINIMPPEFTPIRARTPPDVSVFVVLATAYGRKAIEPLLNWEDDEEPEERRGLLTTALLQCLHDDRVAGRQSTSHSLEEPLRAKMRELAAKARDKRVRKQAPEIMYPSDGVMVLTRNVKKPRAAAPGGAAAADDAGRALALPAPSAAIPVRIIAPDNLTGELVVYDDGMKAIARRRAANATAKKPAWRVKLMPSRRYAVGRATVDAVPQIIEDVNRLPTAEDCGHVYHFPSSG